MTREEAINLIDINRSNLKATNAEGFSKDIEALDMAIEALEQEPCEDAISRQAVEKITWEEPSYTDALNVLTEVRDKVRALPSVNPQEPKTGHWVNRHIIANTSIDMIVCSECGEEFSYDAETGISEYNYCPNCGKELIHADSN